MSERLRQIPREIGRVVGTAGFLKDHPGQIVPILKQTAENVIFLAGQAINPFTVTKDGLIVALRKKGYPDAEVADFSVAQLLRNKGADDRALEIISGQVGGIPLDHLYRVKATGIKNGTLYRIDGDPASYGDVHSVEEFSKEVRKHI